MNCSSQSEIIRVTIPKPKEKAHAMKRITALLILACLNVITARAQLVADGATATIDGVATNIVGDLVVGTNGSFTTLIITNSASVTNSGFGRIGSNNAARTNQVIVTGSNSSWLVGSFLYVGSLGDFNHLVVTNGGWVNSAKGLIGSSTFSTTTRTHS